LRVPNFVIGIESLVTGCPLIHVLDVHNQSNLTDKSLTVIGRHCRNLYELIIHDCTRLSDAGMLQLSQCTNLRKLFVMNCPRISAKGLERLMKSVVLTQLKMTNE